MNEGNTEQDAYCSTEDSEACFVKDTLLILGGGLIGAAVALLYAPQSGEKTRKQLVKRYDKTVEDMKVKGEELSERIEDLRAVLSEQLEEGAEFVGEKREDLLEQLEAIQEKVNGLKKRFGK